MKYVDLKEKYFNIEEEELSLIFIPYNLMHLVVFIVCLNKEKI